MSLARLQREFLEAILAAPEPADARLAVYHRGARANHEAALAAAYPVVRRLVGGPFFSEAAARFGDAVASVSGDLHAYGPQFAVFLARYPHARELDFLPDVARLEWAVHESRYAGEDGGFDFAALGAVPAEAVAGVHIHLRPCVRLMSSPHPILAIWEANQEGRDGTPARDTGPDRVVITRTRTLDVVPVAIEAGGPWALLQAFARGASLAQAASDCEAAGQALEPALRTLAQLDVLGGFEAASP
jgi:hypothetical protein